MKAFVAVTDNDWFHFLRGRAGLDEVNLWRPSGRQDFSALQVGEPLLFKLHSPENFVTGGGFFAHASRVPISLAWEAFGEKNGAPSLHDLSRHIGKQRRPAPDSREDFTIGCIILQNPFFFDTFDWIPAPSDFHLNIGGGKTYDLASSQGRSLWEAVHQRLQASGPVETPRTQSAIFGEPVLIHPRLGEGTFRILITDTYRRRCAITRDATLPALEATHIHPPSQGGQHRIDNGLLLRADLRRLFDHGYITVTPDYTVRVSPRLEAEFDNGAGYRALDGTDVWRPKRTDQRPQAKLLEWHSETVFRGQS